MKNSINFTNQSNNGIIETIKANQVKRNTSARWAIIMAFIVTAIIIAYSHDVGNMIAVFNACIAIIFIAVAMSIKGSCELHTTYNIIKASSNADKRKYRALDAGCVLKL